jgi:hypothetical protein
MKKELVKKDIEIFSEVFGKLVSEWDLSTNKSFETISLTFGKGFPADFHAEEASLELRSFIKRVVSGSVEMAKKNHDKRTWLWREKFLDLLSYQNNYVHDFAQVFYDLLRGEKYSKEESARFITEYLWYGIEAISFEAYFSKEKYPMIIIEFIDGSFGYLGSMQKYCNYLIRQIISRINLEKIYPDSYWAEDLWGMRWVRKSSIKNSGDFLRGVFLQLLYEYQGE